MLNQTISIIIPVYNVEQYLEKCVNSVRFQSYPNLEIILVDDGSTDSCPEICDRFVAEDSRIRVFHKSNGGLSDARNYGLKHTTGKLIGFVDSDDWIERDMYETLYEAMQKYDADITMCGAESVSEDGNIINTNIPPRTIKGYERATVYRDAEILGAHLTKTNDINAGVWNKLYKKEVVEGISFPKGRIYEDVATTFKFLSRASVFVKIYKHGYNYLQRSDSISNLKFQRKNFDSVIANRERYIFIKDSYPQFEKAARERMLTDLLNIGFRLVRSDQIKEFKPEIKKMLSQINILSVFGCGLSKKQVIGFIVFKLNIKAFSKAVKWLYHD